MAGVRLRQASSLAGSLGVDASLLEVSIVALARQLPSAPPSLSANVAGSAAGSGSSSSSSGHTHASGAGMPPVRLPVAASVSGDVGKRTLVTVRVRVQGSGGYMLLQVRAPSSVPSSSSHPTPCPFSTEPAV